MPNASNEHEHTPLLPIGVVTGQTGLTARQIRYYEQNGLIKPARTNGKQRLYSFQDLNRLQEINRLLQDGLNMAGIKKIFQDNGLLPEVDQESAEKRVSETEMRKIFHEELKQAGRFNHGRGKFFNK